MVRTKELTDPTKLGRSFQRGEVTLDEIRTLTKGFHDTDFLFDDEDLQHSEYDIVVADGDLHVKGDLLTEGHHLVGLVVRGSLTVDGLFADASYPVCGVFVHGDMTVGRAITTGTLGVNGSLTARDALVGFYNDYGATVGKDVVTPLFHPETHYFEIGGRLKAKYVVGSDAEYRVPKALKAHAKSLVPNRLRDVLVHEVFEGEGDDAELDNETLTARVRDGKPVLR